MGKRKSSFYHTRWNKVGVNEELAAEILGVSVEQVQQWDIDDTAPIMAERLLLLWDKKRVGHRGWDGFYFSRGAFCYKKQRFTPESLLHLVEVAKTVHSMQQRVAELERHTKTISLGNGRFLELPMYIGK